MNEKSICLLLVGYSPMLNNSLGKWEMSCSFRCTGWLGDIEKLSTLTKTCYVTLNTLIEENY